MTGNSFARNHEESISRRAGPAHTLPTVFSRTRE